MGCGAMPFILSDWLEKSHILRDFDQEELFLFVPVCLGAGIDDFGHKQLKFHNILRRSSRYF